MVEEVWYEITDAFDVQTLVSPARTQPNSVSNAEGEPQTPFRRPWRKICVKISTPRRMSMWPGSLKFGSASERLERCVHSGLKGIGCNGKSHVTRGMIIAVTSISILCSCTGVITNLDSVGVGDSWEWPPIPMILTLWLRRDSPKLWTKCSDTNEAEDPGSRSARDMTEDPSEACTRTRHVIRREWDDKPWVVTPAEWLVTGTWKEAVGGVFCSFWSTCSKVWCDLWHLLRRCTDLHCLTKCPGRRQFMQRSFDFSVDIFLSCGIVLNWWQAKRGCFSLLQRIHVLSELALALAAKNVIGLGDVLCLSKATPLLALVSNDWSLSSEI